MVPISKGPRIDLSGRLFASCIGMQHYLLEVVAEARLHDCASRRIERLTRRAQHFVHNRWNDPNGARIGRLTLHNPFLVLAFRAFAAGHRMITAPTFALPDCAM